MQDREEMSGCMQPVAVFMGVILIIAGIFCLPIAGIGLLLIWMGCLAVFSGFRGTWYY